MQYLVTIHRPHGFDHATEIDAVVRQDIDVLNEAMIEASARVFVGGLQPPSTARTISFQRGVQTILENKLCVTAEEYIDGFWVLDVENEEAAIEWGRKAALACRGNVEVRPFFG